MAILKQLYRTKTTKTHEAYQKYVRQEIAKKKKPMSFRVWSESAGTRYGGPGKGLTRSTLKRKA